MAALPDIAPGSLVDLRSVSAAALSRLLEEEAAVWRKEFSWDFRPSADLVRKFVDMRALTGCAVVRGGQAVGYSYYVCEDGKGLIGDLFVSPSPHQAQDENALLTAILDALWRTPGVDRIETQLMMLRHPLSRSVPYARWFSSHPRQFYEVDLSRIAPARESGGTVPPIIPWSESRQEEAAELIAHSYADHIDSQINDQYRSIAGARRVPAEYYSISGVRLLLRTRFVSGLGPLYAESLCPVSGKFGFRKDGTHHATRCRARASRQRPGEATPAEFSALSGGTRRQARQPDSDFAKPRSHCAIWKYGIPQSARFRRLRLASSQTLTFVCCKSSECHLFLE